MFSSCEAQSNTKTSSSSFISKQITIIVYQDKVIVNSTYSTQFCLVISAITMTFTYKYIIPNLKINQIICDIRDQCHLTVKDMKIELSQIYNHTIYVKPLGRIPTSMAKSNLLQYLIFSFESTDFNAVVTFDFISKYIYQIYQVHG